MGKKGIDFISRIKLFFVAQIIALGNVSLEAARRIIFPSLPVDPRTILIYKVGNIGDIVCAIPSLMAIRRCYPHAMITLLTSPGGHGMPGAQELLRGAWYLDALTVYHAEDIATWRQKKLFLERLRKEQYNLFIQLPDDLANFRTLLRNIFFAKMIGARNAFGFVIRTVQIFKKTQVDFLRSKTEVESLLDLLRDHHIRRNKVEYDFPVSESQKTRVAELMRSEFGVFPVRELLIAVSTGGKRETNQWPKERFIQVLRHLQQKYNAKIVLVGGASDYERAERIKKELFAPGVLISCGKLELLETVELLRYCSFLISNSTGVIHLAAGVGLPAVGMYGVRDVVGRWVPYGANHQILFHNFLDCNYHTEACIKKSIDSITVEEVAAACDRVISELRK